jgi:hypothetical protein
MIHFSSNSIKDEPTIAATGPFANDNASMGRYPAGRLSGVWPFGIGGYSSCHCAAMPQRALLGHSPNGPGGTDMLATLHRMQDRLNATPHLLRIGRLFCETVLIDIDGSEFYLTFRDGRLEQITEGPSRKTPWRFALRTDQDALGKFWQAMPSPGFHDIFGLVKIGRGRIDGDILSLVKNLRFFKEFMALGREGVAA